MKGIVTAVCASAHKGPKEAVERGVLRAGHGMEGDVHAGTWHRQVSLLAEEQIQDMRQRSGMELPPGTFGENLVCSVDLTALDLGRRLRVGPRAVLQVTQRGKECHTPCQIYHKVGECIMPNLGMFTRVRRGGEVAGGDEVATDPALDRHRYAVITLSDRGAAGKRGTDASGAEACSLLEQGLDNGHLLERVVLPDDRAAIERELVRLCDEEVTDLVVTTGGTGLSPRDVTPEATLAVIDRQIPGMAEAMRAAGLAFTPHAMLSRAVCGMRGQSIIVNLSGSPKAVREQLEVLLPVLPHAVQTASGVPMDCARHD